MTAHENRDPQPARSSCLNLVAFPEHSPVVYRAHAPSVSRTSLFPLPCGPLWLKAPVSVS